MSFESGSLRVHTSEWEGLSKSRSLTRVWVRLGWFCAVAGWPLGALRASLLAIVCLPAWVVCDDEFCLCCTSRTIGLLVRQSLWEERLYSWGLSVTFCFMFSQNRERIPVSCYNGDRNYVLLLRVCAQWLSSFSKKIRWAGASVVLSPFPYGNLP